MPFSVILSFRFSIIDPSCGGRFVTGQFDHVYNATIQRFADWCQCIYTDVFPFLAHIDIIFVLSPVASLEYPFLMLRSISVCQSGL